MSISNVESLARLTGVVVLRGYRQAGDIETEFAVTENGWAWIDDGDDGVTRKIFEPTAWDWRAVPHEARP